MKLKLFSRSCNDILFERMKEFIPAHIEVVKCNQFQQWWEASDYLYHIIDDDSCDWVVNCDIDCFIYNWKKVELLQESMLLNGQTHSGMAEGGMHPGRCYAWSQMNPFFNIFNTKRIRELKELSGLSWKQIQMHGFLSEWELKKPIWVIGNYNNEINNEPFHGLFNWLYRFGNPLFLECKTLSDGLACHLDDFCLHTWLSREYGATDTATYRINYFYNVAKGLVK